MRARGADDSACVPDSRQSPNGRADDLTASGAYLRPQVPRQYSAEAPQCAGARSARRTVTLLALPSPVARSRRRSGGASGQGRSVP